MEDDCVDELRGGRDGIWMGWGCVVQGLVETSLALVAKGHWKTTAS